MSFCEDANVWKETKCPPSHSAVNALITIALHALNGQIVFYVDYSSIKMFKDFKVNLEVNK